MMDALQSISPRIVPVSGAPSSGGVSAEDGARPRGRFALPPGAAQGGDARNNAGADSLGLSPEAEAQLRELKQRDAEVRAHERAHMAAGGQYVSGGPHYTYQKGPDGRQYAIGGHVDIDVSAVPGDPEATQQKAEQVRRAATAPGQPSGQDRQVAAEAAAMSAEAARDVQKEHRREAEEASGGSAGAAPGATGRSSAGRAGGDAPAASFATAEIVEEEARHGGMTRAQAREQAHAAQVYADMSMRGVMPTALAPGSFVATSITV
ncbi:MAG: catalase [Desulfovibrio desulfuricans]|jgi:hypothetical protein|nr:catalase [Desulfovibrio desulfuricans]